MGRNNDNIYKAKKMGYNLTLRQLKLWGVKYNKLIYIVAIKKDNNNIFIIKFLKGLKYKI